MDWAYDTVYTANNFATICWVQREFVEWDIVLAHSTNTVAFTHSRYLNSQSSTNCST